MAIWRICFHLAFLTAVGAFTCPPYNIIEPCICDPHDPKVECKFDMTNGHLREVLDSLCAANGLNSTSSLLLDSFYLLNTNLTSIDWSPFANLRVDTLYISTSSNVQTYFGQPGNFGRIRIQRKLGITYSRLTELRIGDSLKQFSPEMRELSLYCNELTGNPADITGQEVHDQGQQSHVEFLPGLATLINLESINLDENLIRKLEKGPFFSNNRLKTLSLKMNVLEKIGPNSFLVAPALDDLKNVPIRVDLEGNQKLGEYGFSPDSGIDQIGRPVQLNLGYCNFTTIPQDVFEKFLRAHPENELDLHGNPLNCDESTDWLREPENVRSFKGRILGGSCKNAPNETVFTWKKSGKNGGGGSIQIGLSKFVVLAVPLIWSEYLRNIIQASS